jgi:hypothetical protein
VPLTSYLLLLSLSVKMTTQYDRKNPAIQKSTKFYKNWIDLRSVLTKYDDQRKEGILIGIQRRKSEITRESMVDELLYSLRTHILILSLFPSKKELLVDIDNHSGWKQKMSYVQNKLCKYYHNIIKDLNQNPDPFQIADRFTEVDIEFGNYRYQKWIKNS